MVVLVGRLHRLLYKVLNLEICSISNPCFAKAGNLNVGAHLSQHMLFNALPSHFPSKSNYSVPIRLGSSAVFIGEQSEGVRSSHDLKLVSL